MVFFLQVYFIVLFVKSYIKTTVFALIEFISVEVKIQKTKSTGIYFSSFSIPFSVVCIQRCLGLFVTTELGVFVVVRYSYTQTSVSVCVPCLSPIKP